MTRFNYFHYISFHSKSHQAKCLFYLFFLYQKFLSLNVIWKFQSHKKRHLNNNCRSKKRGRHSTSSKVETASKSSGAILRAPLNRCFAHSCAPYSTSSESAVKRGGCEESVFTGVYRFGCPRTCGLNLQDKGPLRWGPPARMN